MRTMNLSKFKSLIYSTKIHHSGYLTSLKCSSSSSDLLEKERQLLGNFPGGSVDIDKDERTGIATITLNNPEKKNSLTGTMMIELEKTIDGLEDWRNGRGVMLQGQNNSFCSGIDLSLIKKMQKNNVKEQPRLLSSFMQRLLTRFYCMPLVSVALIEGAALGGGAELATACDMRVMGQDASIGFVQVKMGLSFAFGGSFRLVNMVGRQQALKLLTSAQVMNAVQARESGLVDEVLSGGCPAVEEAVEFLERYLMGSPEVVRAAKQVITNNIDMRLLEDINSKERSIFEALFGGEANLKAVQRKSKF